TVSSPNDTTPANNTVTATTKVNTRPVAQSQSVSTNEDTAKAITLTATDVDSQILSFNIVSGPSPSRGSLGSLGTPSCSGITCTAAITYTPAANYNGPDLFTFRANDTITDSNVATVTITVTPVNDTPVASDGTAATNEDIAVSISLSTLVSDVETANANLTYTVDSHPTHGTLSG